MKADTEAERRVLERSVAGEAADLSDLPDDRRRVRGAFLAALLWGEAQDASGAAVTVHRRGLTVSHARIVGAVDIRDLGAIDGPAPQVSLRHCTSWGGDDGFPLNATAASLVRLDLSHSRLTGVDAHSLRTVGNAEFVRTTIRGEVIIIDSIIGGSLLLSGASLTAPEDRAALSADGADIKGDVFLTPDGGHRFEARGAVRLLGATIGGQLAASGASLTAHDGGYALAADQAEIKGGVFLTPAGDHRFEARGEIRLLGATIGGQLNARGASLTAHDGGGALSADRADIKGSVLLTPAGGHRFEARGAVRLLGATIGGQLDASGASLTAHAGGHALSADRADIKGGVFLTPAGDHRFEARGEIRLLGATIGGQLNARGASLTAHDGGGALSADRADIKGSVLLTPAGGHRFEARGAVRLLGATIGGRFDAVGLTIDAGRGTALWLDGARLLGGFRLGHHNAPASMTSTVTGTVRLAETQIETDCRFSGATLTAVGTRPALDLRGARIDAPLMLDACGADPAQPFRSEGTILLADAQITGDIVLLGSRLAAGAGAAAGETTHTALLATGATITGSVLLGPQPQASADAMQATGRVVLDRATIGGDLVLTGALLTPHPNDDERLTLSLRKARIGDRLKVQALDTTGVIDLSGAHAVVLDDIARDRAQQLGWSPNDANEPPCDPRTGELRGVVLRLHGFTYDTLALPEGNAHASTDFWRARRAWLRRQSPRRHPLPLHYTPQPHEQLVKVLRSLGYGAEADLAARDKRDWQLACRVETCWRRLWARLVGLFFSHYYSSRRGLATVTLFIALGTFGAMWAADRDVLVAADAPPPAARACWPDFAWDVANIWVRAGALAADQFVPVINFQTGTVCTIREDAPTAWAWTLGRIFYALLGLLIVPMAVLTFRGVLRRD